MVKYSKEIELLMQDYYGSLNEKQKRVYAAIESMKLGWGGQSYISNLLGLSRTTLHSGKKAIYTVKDAASTSTRIRAVGGGRKKKK